jgi:hypothetical protein
MESYKMFKKWTLGAVLLSTSLFSQAGFITKDVTGAEMAGMEITAFFEGGGSDTQTWSALSATKGGVETSDWSLTLDGDTFGQRDGAIYYGLWTLSNLLDNSNIIGLTINSAIANIYFDTIEGYDPLRPVVGAGDHTAGSGAGRTFASTDLINTSALFSNVYSGPDLFGTMEITWNNGFSLAANQQYSFMTDTDKVNVPEPSTMFTFALGLMALVSMRKKSSGK